MQQVYSYEGNVLFYENSTPPVGELLGTIIQAHDDCWSFFPWRGREFTRREMSAITERLQVLDEKLAIGKLKI